MVLVQSQLITADDNRHEEHVQVKTLDIGQMVLVQSQLIPADDNRHEEHVQVKTLDIGQTEIQSQQ